MCGIFGYANFHKSVSRRRIFDTLLGGLKKIEYRGYDSAGLCVMDDEGRPFVLRSVGNINALREKVDSQEVQHAIAMDAVLSDHVGLAHTRWATHGEVCERNCHPQQSNHGEFTVVHNGIMTNFTTVKQLLLSEGYTFTSDTDTEVIAVLAQYIYAKKPCTFVELASQLTHFVEGAYALLLTSQHFPGELIACRKGSPLVVGVRSENTTEKNTTIDAPTLCKEGSSTVRPRKYTIFSAPEDDDAVEVFFSSDCNAFAEYTKDVIYLEDNDVVHYSDGQLQFFTASKMLHEVVSRECHVLEMTLESLSKGNYEHFMLKEIFEQSETVVSSMRGRIDFANGEVHLGGFSAQNVHHILNSRRLLFVSCGTSLNSCFAVRPLLEELLAIPVGVENASDFMDRDGCVNRSDTVFFVSQSGETADTLMALQRCRDNGALCVGITNVVGSSISRLTDFGAHLNAGAEVGVASTKAYTSQVVLLTLIALLLSADSRRAEKRRQEVVKGLMDLPNNLTKVLKSMDAPIGALASKLKDSRSIIILGRGFDYATCIEAALKIKELTYIHTEGINSGELKHGPLALVDEDMTVMALCSQDKHADKCKAAVQQVRARKGNLIVFSTARDAELEEAATGGFIELPQTVDCLQCVVNIVPFQLLSYYMALQRGNNVDCPRNLAKSVTVQ